jgi:hypothetical protein
VSARPFHKRFHSDALAGFMSLSLEERGAYQTLLDMIYDRGGPVLDNERLLAGYMQCSIRKWRVLRRALLDKGKISPAVGGCLDAEDFDPDALASESRAPMLRSLRQFVIDRDGRQCSYCRSGDGPFEIDHVVPVARGGSDNPVNLVVACRSCNRSKGALLVEEWQS